ncbi:MAG TPA: hypothetical protein DF984_07605 [Anaerolineaceae bacterium]|jgi:hypothetical protein|nr:hypothetical protein [Anaerolineaceae bacterium]
MQLHPFFSGVYNGFYAYFLIGRLRKAERVKDRVKSILFGLVFLIIGLVFMFVFGQISELRCEKPQLYVVQCSLEQKFLGVFPVSSKTFLDVNDAWVETSCDDDGCSYRVVLLTSDGQQPMTPYYSSGLGAREDMAWEINSYIQAEGTAPLFLTEKSGLFFALFAMIFVLVGLYQMIVKGILQPRA